MNADETRNWRRLLFSVESGMDFEVTTMGVQRNNSERAPSDSFDHQRRGIVSPVSRQGLFHQPLRRVSVGCQWRR